MTAFENSCAFNKFYIRSKHAIFRVCAPLYLRRPLNTTDPSLIATLRAQFMSYIQKLVRYQKSTKRFQPIGVQKQPT